MYVQWCILMSVLAYIGASGRLTGASITRDALML